MFDFTCIINDIFILYGVIPKNFLRYSKLIPFLSVNLLIIIISFYVINPFRIPNCLQKWNRERTRRGLSVNFCDFGRSIMKIVTWNINGIRTAKGPLKTLLDSFDADVICFQETKVTRSMLDQSIVEVDGYSTYFSYSRKRGGYSGVATYCRDFVRPVAAEEGISGYYASLLPGASNDKVGCYGALSGVQPAEQQRLDEEGRVVITEHAFKNIDDGDQGSKSVCIFNVYCPRVAPDREDRKDYKLWFCQMLQVRVEALLAHGK